MLLWLLGCIATPGLHTDGVVPAAGQGQGMVGGGAIYGVGGGTSVAGAGLGGDLGLGKDVGLGAAAVWAPTQDMLAAEARVMTPMLGSRADPRLTFVGGGDAALSVADGVDFNAWWLEAGVVAGGPLAPDLRLYGGAVANWAVEDGVDGIWLEPTLGIAWRPQVARTLTALVGLEAAAMTDFDSVGVGPLVYVGLAGAPADRPSAAQRK